MATKAEILDAISGMTVLELSELIKEMEEKFGVSAAAAAVAAAAVAAPFVGRSVGAVVDWGEGQFIEPAGDVALGGDEAAGGAGAH